MTDADRPAFARAVAQTVAAVGLRAIDEARVSICFAELSDLPLAQVEKAFAIARRECKFFPSVAELRQFARGRYDGLGAPAPRTLALPAPPEDPISPEAWRDLIGSIGRRVAPATVATERPDAADLEPTPEERAAREAQRERLREQARTLGVSAPADGGA